MASMNVRAPLFATLMLALSGTANAATLVFPSPGRPVAPIVSPTWGDLAARDEAREVEQIAARLRLRSGMTVADIGAGSGYDALRLAAIVGSAGSVIAEDVTPAYLRSLRDSARARARSQRPNRARRARRPRAGACVDRSGDHGPHVS